MAPGCIGVAVPHLWMKHWFIDKFCGPRVEWGFVNLIIWCFIFQMYGTHQFFWIFFVILVTVLRESFCQIFKYWILNPFKLETSNTRVSVRFFLSQNCYHILWSDFFFFLIILGQSSRKLELGFRHCRETSRHTKNVRRRR